ncbi:hypothetical protein I5677_14840 [Mobilitalea sibirica]|uniref:NHL repeat-containing protein n=1 Tax=Mobilitalea sibirica TaxID=1462919 RepID=A0A8J7H0V0_9FIRM|nr:hypothetical protein [Mobilitalea sibirica]MBH1942174.1 hypothetical protein [Mobilitalea sibirica]
MRKSICFILFITIAVMGLSACTNKTSNENSTKGQTVVAIDENMKKEEQGNQNDTALNDERGSNSENDAVKDGTDRENAIDVGTADGDGNQEEIIDKEVETMVEGERKEITARLETFLEMPNQRAFGVEFTESGQMYIVCAPSVGNGTLFRVSSEGEMTEICTVEGQFIGPGIAINSKDEIYITVGRALKKYSVDGSEALISEGFKNAFDVTLDKEDNLYVADETDEIIYKILPTGEKEVFLDFTPKSGRRFQLDGIEYSPKDDCLYIAYGTNVYKHPITNTEEGIGEPYYEAETDLRCLAIDTEGNVYVDTANTLIEVEYDTLNSNIYKMEGNSTNYIGLNFGKGEFGENILYITTEKEICKFQK